MKILLLTILSALTLGGCAGETYVTGTSDYDVHPYVYESPYYSPYYAPYYGYPYYSNNSSTIVIRSRPHRYSYPHNHWH